MSEISIGELVGGVSLNDTFSGPILNVAAGLGVASESFKAVTGFAGLAAGAIAATTGAIIAMGSRGSDIVDVQDGFAGLAREASSSAGVMLGALQRGTLNTISNFELMRLGNEALGSGLIKSSSDMETLAAGAKLLSGRVGGDTAKAFDTLTNSINSGKTTALKQLGVFVDSEAAVDRFARSLGKSVGDLTAHEKATAVSQATLANLKGQLEAAGPASASFADKISQGKVAVGNLVDSLSVAIATSPVLATGLDALTKGIQSAFGSSQQETVKTLMGFVNQFGIFLIQVVQAGVSGAQFLSNAWSGLKVVFNEFMALFVGQAGVVIQGVQAIVDALVPVQDLAKSMGFARDFIDEAFDGVKRGVASAGASVEAMRQSFKDQSAEALDNAAAQNAAFDQIQEALTGVEGQMRAAAAAQTEGATASDAAATGLRRVTEAAGLTEAQIKAMEDQTRKGLEALQEMAEQGADKMKSLQDEITLSNLTGVDARLFVIEQARENEIAGLQALAFMYPQLYDQMTALVQEKYAGMAEAARVSFDAQAAAAVSSSMTQQQQAQVALDQAKIHLAELEVNSKSSYTQIAIAYEAMQAAQEEVDRLNTAKKLERLDMIASSASGILRSIFGKNKAAAIAAAVIDVAAAIVKCFAQFGWWGFIPAAAVAAAGYEQIQQIRNTNPEGFAQGTPDMAFMDFGRSSLVPLHEDEAVVNRAQGATLAEMVVDAVELRDDRVLRQLERMDETQRARDRNLPLLMRDMALLARA